MKRTEEALIWLRQKGGVGVVNRHGQVVAPDAKGEVSRQFHPSTWLHLVVQGFIEAGPGFTIQIVNK